MSATYSLMGDPEGDDRLNDTDRAIVALLAEGRETTGSLAEELDKHPQTVRDRLRWLREWGYVRYHHESTGLHQISLEETDGE